MLFVMKVSGSVNSPRLSLSKKLETLWECCVESANDIIPRRNTTVPVCEMKMGIVSYRM